MPDVALASCADLPEPDFDEAPLLDALMAADISAEVLAWDDPAADFSRARLTILRSTWNYPVHRDAFLSWIEATAHVSQLWNPPPVVAWSSHKRYLLDLEGAGVAVTPTELVDAGSSRSLGEVMRQRGWDDVVVKPAVSAASLGTRRVKSTATENGQTHLEALTRTGDVLIQQYMPSVEGHGERALVWIDGELTHAVRKSPRFEGDDELVSKESVAISSAEAALAHRALGAASGFVDAPLMYARVDVAPGPDQAPVVMELELIEPSLFFPQCEAALARFVAAVEKLLARA